jgi:hypothetical protein
MFITEADNLKLDGARIWHNFGQHWIGSTFVGGYPNPYSRSLLTDYTAPCGAGVAGDLSGTATGPCTASGPQLGVGLGAGARYFYNTLWGSVGVVGSFFDGPGDGGPVKINTEVYPYGSFGVTPNQPNLAPPDLSLTAPRIYLAWLNSWRPAERFDLFTDLVVDLYGSAGPQLTRLVLLGTIRILRDDRLTLRIGASYMSSLAIDMYMSRLVYNRVSGTTLGALGISAVENNLTILGTGRAEGRATLDARIVRRLGAFVEGRVRYRDLISGSSDASVYVTDTTNSASMAYLANVPSLAGDFSVGLRDNGSLAGIRASLVYTGLFDYLATDHVINFEVGRDFWRERIGVTLNYVAAFERDKLVGTMNVCSPIDPFAACFGMRSGATHEAGLTLTVNPWRTLFFLIDYRFVALLTDPQPPGQPNPTTFPTVLSNAMLGRIEFRW